MQNWGVPSRTQGRMFVQAFPESPELQPRNVGGKGRSTQQTLTAPAPYLCPRGRGGGVLAAALGILPRPGLPLPMPCRALPAWPVAASLQHLSLLSRGLRVPRLQFIRPSVSLSLCPLLSSKTPDTGFRTHPIPVRPNRNDLTSAKDPKSTSRHIPRCRLTSTREGGYSTQDACPL